MRKILLSVYVFAITGFASAAIAWTWGGVGRAIWGGVKAVGKGVLQVANAAQKLITGYDFLNKPTSFAEKLAWFTEDCWFCGVFDTLFDIMNTIVTEVCHSMQSVFLTMLGLGLLFWLLFRIGRVMIDITGEADTKLVPDIFKQGLRVSVASLMIVFYLDIFDYAFSPALEMSMGIGNEVLSSSQDAQEIYMVRTGGPNGSVEEATTSLCPDYDTAVAEADQQSGFRGRGTGKDKAYSEVLKQAFLCYIQIGEKSFSTGMAIGATAISSWSDRNIISKVRHLELLIIGLEIFLVFFLLFLAFPTKLFDPLMNLTFVSAMFPLWAVLWAFPATNKSYAQKALGLFIGVLVHLLVISVMSMMVIEIMNSALGSQETRTQLLQKLLGHPTPEDPYDIFIKTYGFGVVGKPILLTAALGILAYLMFQKTSAVAGKFGDLIDFGIGQQANSLMDQGVGLTAQSVKNVGAAGAHVVHAKWQQAAQRDDGVGRAARAIGRWAPAAVAAATLMPFAPAAAVAAAGAARFIAGQRTPVPQNRVFSGSLWDRFVNTKRRKDLARNQMWLNKSRGKSARRNKTTKEWDTWDSNTKTYQQLDKHSRLQNSYKKDTGDISMNGVDYKFRSDPADPRASFIESGGVRYKIDGAGRVSNDTSGAPVDARKIREIQSVLAFQQKAEQDINEHQTMMAHL